MNRVSLILRQKIVGIVLIITAALGGIFVFWYINNLKSGVLEGVTKTVFITTRDIRQGEELTFEMFEEQKISNNIFIERFITDQEQISGRTALTDILKNEIITADKLEGSEFEDSIDLRFSAYIPDGLRAISIPVKYYGDHGLISSGDRVDIISTYYTPDEDKLYSETILSGKEIILISNAPGIKGDEGLSGEEDYLFGSIIGQNTGDYEQGKLIVITFYLEPYDVETIFLALDRGLLNLSILPKTNPVSF